MQIKFFQFSENETEQWNMKTNSSEAIVGWMVLIRNLGLSWFLVKEKPETELLQKSQGIEGRE